MESYGSWFEGLFGVSIEGGQEENLLKEPIMSHSIFDPLHGILNKVSSWFYREKHTTRSMLFQNLSHECRKYASGARLSQQLCEQLEKLPRDERKEIVSLVTDGCAPLFLACLRGHLEIVEYLIIVCGADIEQRGLYENPEDKSVHCGTPLWCAAVTERFDILKFLIKRGADVNAVTDSGSTPVRSACLLTHMDIVTYLVKHGADILKPNYVGITCLINSIQSALLCRFLLQNGAAVNASDYLNKTALHFAIEDQRIETVAVLLDYGADPHARSKSDDDALRTACLKGSVPIFYYLLQRISYEPERLADAYELIGSTLLDEHNDFQGTLVHWRVAIQLRRIHGGHGEPLPKRPLIPAREAFRNAKEFVTEQDLEDISIDMDAMRTQCLLIYERVLGEQHEDTLHRLTVRGAVYANALRYRDGLVLWHRALEVSIARDSVLCECTCLTAQTLVEMLVCVDEDERMDDGMPRLEDIVAVFQLLSDNLLEVRHLLEIFPVDKRQEDNYNRIFRCLTHLIYILVKTSTTENQRSTVERTVRKLVQRNPCAAVRGDSLLHLCLSRQNTIICSVHDHENQVRFPDLEVVRLLLRCGANVNAQNSLLVTPLHVATHAHNFNNVVIKNLLDNGAHLDQSDRGGIRPSARLRTNLQSDVDVLKYTTLRCLAAVAIVVHKIPYQGQIPTTLEKFVMLH